MKNKWFDELEVHSCSDCFVLTNYSIPESGKERFFWITTLVVATISSLLLSASIVLYGISWHIVPPGCITITSSLFLLIFSYKPPSIEIEISQSSIENNPDAHEGLGKGLKSFLHEEKIFPRPQNREIGECILSLPNETIINVFSFLPVLDLCRVRKVCTVFKDCADNELLWESAAIRISHNLGERRVLLGSAPRVEHIKDSWRIGMFRALDKNQICVVESNYFSIVGGLLYYYSSEGNFFSCSCDGDYKRVQYPLSLNSSPESQWIFALKERGGIACDGKNLFAFLFDTQEAKPIDFTYIEAGQITAISFCEKDQLLIGTDQGALQLYKKLDESYQFEKNVTTDPISGAIISIRTNSDWIVFLTKSQEKSHSLYGVNKKTDFSVHFPLLDKPDRSCCFTLSENYLVVGNDDQLTICDLKFEEGGKEKIFPKCSHSYGFAEIHGLEIEGNHLRVAYSRNQVGVEENHKTHWIRERGCDFDDPNEYLSLILYNFSLAPAFSGLHEDTEKWWWAHQQAGNSIE